MSVCYVDALRIIRLNEVEGKTPVRGKSCHVVVREANLNTETSIDSFIGSI